jgi:hypothetical protein
LQRDTGGQFATLREQDTRLLADVVREVRANAVSGGSSIAPVRSAAW